MKPTNIIDFQQKKRKRRSQQVKSRMLSTLTFSGVLLLVGVFIYSYVTTVDLLSHSVFTTPKQ